MYIEAIINSINVFIAYFLLIVVLSSIILKPLLKKESLFKRFLIYIVFGNIYISSIVFVLGYMKTFNRLTLILSIIFTGTFIRVLLNRKEAKEGLLSAKTSFYNILLGKYGVKLFLWRKGRNLVQKIRGFFHEILDGKKLEWLIFLSILVYNLYQYGINNIRFSTYMAPDEEVHLYWIQSLLGGNIFPSGVYPHVFHNVISALVELFDFNGMVALRYFGLSSCILIMTMLYFGLRKIFSSKYPALFGFMIYSIIDIYSLDSTYRFQFTIPQEYGMIMLMPIAIFLFDYIKDKHLSDLIFFGISLSLTVGIHFYTGIIAIILCISIVIVYMYRIIREKIWLKLFVCGLLSGIVAIGPLGIGLALGYEMEQSMNWASEVIQGDIYSDGEDDSLSDEAVEDKILTRDKFLKDVKKDITKYVVNHITILYLFLSIIIFSIILNFILMIIKKRYEKNMYQISFGVNSLILVFLMLFRSLEWPTIMETKRVAIFFAYFSSIWIGMPLEIIIRTFNSSRFKKIIPPVSIGVIGLGLFLVLEFNLLRPIPPFYYFQTTGAMLTNMSIMEDYEDHTWTAVSPVNNISAILNHGYHYELSDFILEQENWSEDKQIIIPTEYVFIYIEKKPLIKFGNAFNRNDPEIVNRDTIKREDAFKPLDKNTEENWHYKNQRHTLMAKAYYWAEEYQKYFPNEMNVYYEDSEIVVYRVKQNQYALNNFSIDYEANSR